MFISRKRPSAAPKLLMAVGLATICAGAASAVGDTYHWNNSSGGAASEPNNWLIFGFPATEPPGAEDNLRFADQGVDHYSVSFNSLVPQSQSMYVEARVRTYIEFAHTTGPVRILPGFVGLPRLQVDGVGLSCTTLEVGSFTSTGQAELLVTGGLSASGDLTAGWKFPSPDTGTGIVNVSSGSLSVANALIGTGVNSTGQVTITGSSPASPSQSSVTGDLDIGYNGSNGTAAGSASVTVNGNIARVDVSGTTHLGDPDNDSAKTRALRVQDNGRFTTGSLVADRLGSSARLAIEDGWVFTDTLDVDGHVELDAVDPGSHAYLSADSGTISGGLVIGSNGYPTTFAATGTAGTIQVSGSVPGDFVSIAVGPAGTLNLRAHLLPTAAVLGANGYRQDAGGTLRVEYMFSSVSPVHGLLDVSGGSAYLDGTLRIDVLATPAENVEHVILKAANLSGTTFSTVNAPSGWSVVYDYTSTPQTVRIRFTAPVACSADFNNSGTVSVQDIFDFLAAFFSHCEAPGDPPCYRSADVNSSGTISVQDIFTFLEHYFSGCI